MRDYRHCGHMWSWRDCHSCQAQRWREDQERRRQRTRPAWSWRKLL